MASKISSDPPLVPPVAQSTPPPAVSPVMRATFALNLAEGLHARPAALIVRTAQRFASRITLEKDGATANARSILGLLGLAAGRGSQLKIAVQGPDAPQALAAFKLLFESGFPKVDSKANELRHD